MIRIKQIQRDYDIVCKNCGYVKGVHSILNYYCPLDDPYVQVQDREFDYDSHFEPILSKGKL